MEFCLDCGKPLKIENNTAVCSCGFKKQVNPVTTSEKITKPEEKGEGVADKTNSGEGKGFPHQCKKCGYGFADVVDLGVFYSDESNIYLFKCKKCSHTERDAYGCSNAW